MARPMQGPSGQTGATVLLVGEDRALYDSAYVSREIFHTGGNQWNQRKLKNRGFRA